MFWSKLRNSQRMQATEIQRIVFEIKIVRKNNEYLEAAYIDLIKELKKQNHLSDEFYISTKVGRYEAVEKFVDDFLAKY